MIRRRDRSRTLARALCAAAVLMTWAASLALAAPTAAIAQANGGLKRGDILPEASRGQVVSDYQRWRLRRPPEGYAWYRVGGQFVMASMATGVIFDIVDAR